VGSQLATGLRPAGWGMSTRRRAVARAGFLACALRWGTARADEAPQCIDCACPRPEIAALASVPERDWHEDFASGGVIHGAGTYVGREQWAFESFSLSGLQPSPTALVQRRAPGAITLVDPEPGLRRNRAPPPPWSAARGSVSLTGWVDARFAAVLVEGTVNAASGPEGSHSRQGLIARWDRHHSYYWFYVDFAEGLAAIAKQSPGTAAAVPLPGAERRIPRFSRTRPYRLQFRLVGDALQGRVLDAAGALLAETPEIHDPQPHPCGIAGVNAEPSMAAPFEPLRASFAAVSAVAVVPPR